MPRSERAKQFAPFNPLRGLYDALKVKEMEIEKVQKGELSEEKARKLSKILINLEKNTVISLVFYKNGQILNLQGTARLNFENSSILVNNEEIYLNDIIDISLKQI